MNHKLIDNIHGTALYIMSLFIPGQFYPVVKKAYATKYYDRLWGIMEGIYEL